MKLRSTTLKVAIYTLFVSSTGLTFANGTTNLPVTASISGICKFTAGSSPLNFGVIDPSLAPDAVVTANVLYRCTNKTPSLGVTVPVGQRSMTGSVGNTTPLLYTLTLAGGTQIGAGFGATKDLTLVVTGTITALQYQNVSADSYAETVVLSITP